MVKVLVSHEAGSGAPVVFETNPTYHRLFGRIDYRSMLGAVSTDHMQIRSGAMHRANGGYLVLQAADVLVQPFVWQKLKDDPAQRAAAAREHRLRADAVPHDHDRPRSRSSST